MRRITQLFPIFGSAFLFGLAFSACDEKGLGDAPGVKDGGAGDCKENCGGKGGGGGAAGGAGGGAGGDLAKCGDVPPTAGAACEVPGKACGYCADGGAARKCVCDGGKWVCGGTDAITCPKPDGGTDGGDIPKCAGGTKPDGACEMGARCTFCSNGMGHKCECDGGKWVCGPADAITCPKPDGGTGGAGGTGGTGGAGGTGGSGGGDIPKCPGPGKPEGACEKGAACVHCGDAGALKCFCDNGSWSCLPTDGVTCP